MLRLPPRRRGGAVAALVAGALLTSALTAPTVAAQSRLQPFDAVDQFIGTELDPTQNKSNDAYGNTFPGAAVPFGLVQSSPTTFRTSDGNSKGGYEYTADQIRGFGMNRFSGSGCTGRYGAYDFPIIPFTQALTGGALPTNPRDGIRDYYLDFDHAKEKAEPGYYSVALDNGVTTELTASRRVAVSRFDFPGTGDSTLLLDVSGPNNRVFGSGVTIDAGKRTVSGWVDAAALCDVGTRYKAYFSATFDQPFTHGVWDDGAITPGGAQATGENVAHGTGAYLTFADGARVTARIGLSYVSAENAAENRDTEVGHRSFAAVRAQAARSWRDALGTIDITGGTDEERTTFYTALYHALLHPNVFNDVNGEYMGYDQRLHRVERGREFYVQFAGWDMYRGHAQLLALLFPERANDINQSIVLMAQQKGTWVDGPTLNQAQARMSGDSLQVVVSEMDAFGSTGYDRRGALESMVRTQSLPADRTSRAYGYQYFTTGFIENRKGDVATSRVLEYSVDDFAIAQLARRLGDRATYARFMVRAQNWQHVFDDQSKEIRPRERTGFDRTMRLTVREDNARREQFNQSTGHQYGWMVPHNIGTLVDKRGGVEASTRALDTLMADLDAGAYDKTGNYLSNQPSFNSPYVYNWLRAPHRTTDVLRRAVTEMYDTTPSGLPGNDDQGSLSAWYVWANLGIAPVIYGTANLVVSAPMFEKVRIASAGSGRVITIRAPGAGRGAPYTIGLSVNGEPRSASWLGEDFARAGGSLRFTMSATPGTWGTGAGDVPPSYTDGGDARNNIGVSPDGDGRMASLDLSDNSLSRERLAAAGAAPGAELPHGDTGAVFTWPDTEPGEPDNWLPYGQRVDLPDTRAAGISFLGLATNGPAQGAATVEYTDGSTQQVMVRLTDWSAGSPAFGNTALVQTVGRNNARGDSDTLPAKVFATAPEALDATRTVTAVILPQGSDRGVMHIFDVATSR